MQGAFLETNRRADTMTTSQEAGVRRELDAGGTGRVNWPLGTQGAGQLGPEPSRCLPHQRGAGLGGELRAHSPEVCNPEALRWPPGRPLRRAAAANRSDHQRGRPPLCSPRGARPRKGPGTRAAVLGPCPLTLGTQGLGWVAGEAPWGQSWVAATFIK